MRSWFTAGFVFSICCAPCSTGQRLADNFKLENGKLTAHFQGCLLQSASEQLAAATHVGIVLAKGLADDLISADFNGVSVEQGFRDLFSGYDTFFFYDGSKTLPATLATVWVYPKGSAASLRPAGPAEVAVAKELEAALEETDTRVREASYEALLERPDDRSRRLVIDALRGSRENDAALRERLLSSALIKGFPVPEQVLAELARADQSEQIRWIALDALAERPSAKQSAEAAMTDPSAAIRARAQEILTQASDDNQRVVREADPATP